LIGKALAVLLLATGLGVRAQLVAPGSAVVAGSLAVIDERGAPRDFKALASGVPTVLLPIFTGCGGTCPTTTEALKRALREHPAGLRVILLSFDPTDTAEDLRSFRSVHGLPAGWSLVRGADAAATRAFLDRFGFQIMTDGRGFNHPDEALVLSPGGAWAGSFFGGVFSSRDLDRAYEWALSADAPTFTQRLRRPRSWILLIAAGFAASIGVVFSLEK
jgi:cytochrome oxidase Cu insertion factor (SCO1/SenC/PrrC family)